MTQERLNGLATYSIEKDVLTNADLNVVLNDFALLDGIVYFEKHCIVSNKVPKFY
jgi:hypothetical protein